MDVLSVKCLVYAKDQVILVMSAGGLQEMVTKMNDSVKNRGTKVNVSKTKLVVCLLCRSRGHDCAAYALPAGFLAGIAFRASPSTTIALAPLTSTLQILGSWAYQRGALPEHWPLVEILYCLCQGLLFHARVMHEDVCPRYIIDLMHTVTSANKCSTNRHGECRVGCRAAKRASGTFQVDIPLRGTSS
ncbi:hypothetical protein EVAR_93518_1 [Eumeta japonica]|uniref:Reverse transcriptase domain-containing protein n=1 Tax=Eumeta variegata TaxID=151549 RepID=A0A4C1TJD0_EUMVA|nr:hypothetical protein EVAR_93518_1 [Eumeta japonica]